MSDTTSCTLLGGECNCAPTVCNYTPGADDTGVPRDVLGDIKTMAAYIQLQNASIVELETALATVNKRLAASIEQAAPDTGVAVSIDIRKLGARLAELLDEDQWNNIEPMLIAIDHDFKNFHRNLCERFDYFHDERDWKRDQVSLIEWIAAQRQANRDRIAFLEGQSAELSRQYAAAVQGEHCPDCHMIDWRDYYTGPVKTHKICASCNHIRYFATQPAQAAPVSPLPSTPEEVAPNHSAERSSLIDPPELIDIFRAFREAWSHIDNQKAEQRIRNYIAKQLAASSMVDAAPSTPEAVQGGDVLDAERFRQAIALEDNLDALWCAIQNNGSDGAAIRAEFDEYLRTADDCQSCAGLGEVQGQGSYPYFEPPINKCRECNGTGKK